MSFDVVVVGAGVSGATAAHAIATLSPTTRVCVLERGAIGKGDEHSTLEVPNGGGQIRPFIAGSGVFDSGDSRAGASCPGTVKMMVTLYAATSREFLHEHSPQDASTWFKMTSRGLELQKRKAKELNVPLVEKGSIMVAPPEKAGELEEEFQLLKEAGCNVRQLTSSELRAQVGEDAGFTAGLLFPDDSIIDSCAYAQALLREAQRLGDVQVRERCSGVVSIEDGDAAQHARVLLASGEEVRGRHVVVATGAFWHGGALAGLLRPCYSYLVALPATLPPPGGGMQYPESPNLFTFGFSHDWCMAGGMVRMSGEDHFSALKAPKADERCRRLAQWTQERFPKQIDASRAYVGRYGVYSETPDLLPLLGTASDASSVIYLCGCNAWGQAILSCLGHMVPALLGLRALDSSAHEPRIAEL